MNENGDVWSLFSHHNLMNFLQWYSNGHGCNTLFIIRCSHLLLHVVWLCKLYFWMTLPVWLIVLLYSDLHQHLGFGGFGGHCSKLGTDLGYFEIRATLPADFGMQHGGGAWPSKNLETQETSRSYHSQHPTGITSGLIRHPMGPFLVHSQIMMKFIARTIFK